MKVGENLFVGRGFVHGRGRGCCGQGGGDFDSDVICCVASRAFSGRRGENVVSVWFVLVQLGWGLHRFCWSFIVCIICVPRRDSSFVATAEEGIVGGVFGGELFVMVHLSARRRISSPAWCLE